MKRFIAILATVACLLAAAAPAARAQGCGSTNPNCVVPLPPPGDNTNRAAPTSFVHAAIASLPGGSTGQVQTNAGGGTFGGLTNAQLTALINPATATLSGALPAWPNNTSTFFRGDGTYVTLNCAALAGVAASCSTDTTNASNISTGTLAAARGGAGTITGALKGNGSGVVSQGACADLSNAAASCATDATNANNISAGTLPSGRIAGAYSGLTGTGTLAVTSNAANALAVGPNGATNPAFQVDASTASQASGIKVTGAVTAGAVAIVAIDSGPSTNLTLSAKGGGAVSIGNSSTGGVALGNATGGSISVNNLLDASAATAGQVKFPSTQNASADANTLDDYKEATFTPVLSFGGGSTGITYGAQIGVITKVGRMVQATVNITLTNKGSSAGAASITGLPVTSASGSDSPCAVQINNFAAGTITTVQAQVSASTSAIGPSRYAAGANTGLADTDFTNTSVFKATCNYISPT